MKKIIAVLLSILILLGNFPVYAENIDSNQNNKPKIITCDEKSTDEMCSALDISKTEIELRSYLKDGGVPKDLNFGPVIGYKAYIYNIKNNSNKSIYIRKLQRKSPYSIVANKIPSRICYQILGIPFIAVSIIYPPGFVYFVGMEIQTIILAPFRDAAALGESMQFKQYHYPIEIKPGGNFKAKIFAPNYKVNFIIKNQEYSIVK